MLRHNHASLLNTLSNTGDCVILNPKYSTLITCREVGGSLDDFEKAGMEMLTPAESGDLLVKLIAGLTPADSGKFLDYKGNELPY